MNRCECGCGESVRLRFKKGHGRRGKKNSPAHNAAIIAANKGRIRSVPAWNKGMSGVFKHSEESKKKIAEMARKNGIGKWMIGRKLSPESIEKTRLANIGRKMSEEGKRKISKANSAENNGMYGQSHTQEAKDKIGAAAKKHWADNREAMLAAANTPEKREKLRLARLKMIFPLKDTIPEQQIASLLSAAGISFEAHRAMDCGKFSYQCDFFVPSMNMVIEADGIYWHKFPSLRPIDIYRTTCLQSSGIKVVRLWEHEIDKLFLRPELLVTVLSDGHGECLKELPLTDKYRRFEKKYGIV